jgi:hypothetical protein
MKQDVREMIKNVIEENAIKFKTSTSTALYQKIGNRLKDEYKNVAKKMFNSLQESAPAGDATMAPGSGSSEEISAAVAPPGGGPGSREREPGGNPGMTEPNPDLERPDTTIDEWVQQRPNINDYDTDGDGRLSNDERAAYERELRKWYDVYVDLYLRWYHYQRRFNNVPYRTPKSPAWRDVVGSQTFDPEQARQRRRARERRRS